MDPVTIALSLLLKNPGAAASAYGKAMAPGVVNTQQLQESVADLSREVLHCYHKTARFQQVDPLGSPWNRQSQYGAENSMVIRITYYGVTRMPYQMIVAVMAKGNQVRTAVLNDSATIPYARSCQLENWTS